MRFRPNKLNIAYTPWESTKTKRGWVAKFNQADEVWTTSDTIAQWYLDGGVTQASFCLRTWHREIMEACQEKQ
jgi:hypothetical protein